MSDNTKTLSAKLHEQRSEANQRETLIRVMHSTYLGLAAWTNEEFVSGMRERLSDPEFRAVLSRRLKGIYEPSLDFDRAINEIRSIISVLQREGGLP